MYLPRSFEETDLATLHAFVRTHPLGTLITTAQGELCADHIPLMLSDDEAGAVLRGHVARANPLWRNLESHPKVLVVFHEAGRYITPSWYATKKASGKVVPTWNLRGGACARSCPRNRGYRLAARVLEHAHCVSRSSPTATVAALRCPERLHRQSAQGRGRHRDPHHATEREMEDEPEPGARGHRRRRRGIARAARCRIGKHGRRHRTPPPEVNEAPSSTQRKRRCGRVRAALRAPRVCEDARTPSALTSTPQSAPKGSRASRARRYLLQRLAQRPPGRRSCVGNNRVDRFEGL